MKRKDIQMIGVGSPVVDFVTEVQEESIALVEGAKGGMELIEPKQLEGLLDLAEGTPYISPGGSAGNTTFALARMGLECAFLGKLGADSKGRLYREKFDEIGGNCTRFKNDEHLPTACCVSMVTPDSERTMRTCLGAAQSLSPDEIEASDFEGCRHVHVEGYLLFNRSLIDRILKTAKTEGCQVSLDLGSFEMVREAQNFLPQLLSTYVDIVFANSEEAAAFAGDNDPEAGLNALAKHCRLAAVKVGPEGAWLKEGDQTVRVPAVPTEKLLDTTGAGDFWAAGFLFGYLNGHSIMDSGRVASLMGRSVIEHHGAELPRKIWDGILSDTATILCEKEKIEC